eukprot:10436325-Heterocapsa_arctica.AAC.1
MPRHGVGGVPEHRRREACKVLLVKVLVEGRVKELDVIGMALTTSGMRQEVRVQASVLLGGLVGHGAGTKIA